MGCSWMARQSAGAGRLLAALIDSFTHRVQRSAVAQRAQIGASQTAAGSSEGRQVHIFGHGLAAHLHLQNGQTLRLIGQADFNDDVKAPWPQQRRVDHVGPIGSGQHQHALEFFDAVEFGQELTDHALADTGVGCATAAPWHQCIDLVEEDQTGRCLLGFLKHFAHGAFRFADVLGHQRRPFD